MLRQIIDPAKAWTKFKKSYFETNLLIGVGGTLRWMPVDPTDGKSTLGQLMALCCRSTSH